MAYATGTANDALDFYDKLVAFLTTNTDLVTANQDWSVVWDTPAPTENQTDIVLMGPGLSNQDQVFVGLQLRANPATGLYALQSRAMTGIIGSATAMSEHINVLPKPARMMLIDAPMTYWFVASGRRFIAVAKLSTRYEAMYAGLFLPYGVPTSYPYPMFIGGSASSEGSGGVTNWTSDVDAHSMFYSPYMNTGQSNVNGGVQTDASAAQFLNPEGTWNGIASRGTSHTYMMLPEATYPTYFGSESFSAKKVMDAITSAFGGERQMFPLTIANRDQGTVYGQLDGIFYAAGSPISSEDTFTIGSENYLIVQNVFRTASGNFMAVKIG